uniref:UBA domain-containing protein n=1 Tax=Ciona savignyi TaxID=51511 RepID=H2ZLU7_CIOSA
QFVGKMTSRCSTYCSMTVTDLHGNDTTVNVSSEMLIEKIKEMAVKQISSDSETPTESGQYRLVLIGDVPRSLCDDKTAKQESLSEGDSALLLKNRGHKQPMSSLIKDAVLSHEGPSSSMILRATESLPALGSDMIGTATSSEQVEQTLRKVLLALLDLSYKFMHFDEDKKVTKPEHNFNDVHVKNLTDMGFSERRAKKALLLNNMNTNLAMEWLLQHADEPSDGEDACDPEPMETGESSTNIRQRLRAFKPNPIHLASLLDMGFSKEESIQVCSIYYRNCFFNKHTRYSITHSNLLDRYHSLLMNKSEKSLIQALKINGNNPNTACEWLLSDRTTGPTEDTDNDEALSPDSELYKALLSNPTIHIGLHDRKVLEALEDMVENPWRRNNWAYESAVGNVILQILKLYNKYSTS